MTSSSPPPLPSEAELNGAMARLAEGDRNAFNPLFRALYARAVRVARSRLSEADAAEAAQSALMKVFANASSFIPGKPVLPWFYAIVVTEVHMLARQQSKQKLRTETDPHGELTSADPDPEHQLVTRELEQAVEQAIGALDPASAEAIFAVLGRAPKPGITGSAYRKRVSRAYERMRVLLRGFYAG